MSTKIVSTYGAPSSIYKVRHPVTLEKDQRGIVITQIKSNDSGNLYEVVTLDMYSAKEVCRQLLELIK